MSISRARISAEGPMYGMHWKGSRPRSKGRHGPRSCRRRRWSNDSDVSRGNGSVRHFESFAQRLLPSRGSWRSFRFDWKGFMEIRLNGFESWKAWGSGVIGRCCTQPVDDNTKLLSMVQTWRFPWRNLSLEVRSAFVVFTKTWTSTSRLEPAHTR